MADSRASDLASEFSSLFDRFSINRGASPPSPLFFTVNIHNSGTGGEPPRNRTGERIVLINPYTQGMVIIEGTSSLEALLQMANVKSGQPPASKASILAMPTVAAVGDDGGDSECVICLEDWEVAKEMPCKHRFHEQCIKKWLEIHGSCPVCRYTMPEEETQVEKKVDDDDHDEAGREIWVSFSFNGRRNQNSGNQIRSTESNDSASTESGPSEGSASTESNDSASTESSPSENSASTESNNSASTESSPSEGYSSSESNDSHSSESTPDHELQG